MTYLGTRSISRIIDEMLPQSLEQCLKYFILVVK